MENLPNVFKALDEALANKDVLILSLQYRVEDLEKKLAEVEASNQKNEQKGEVA